MNRLDSRLAVLGVIALSTLAVAPALVHATPEFPRTITNHLGLPQDPQCGVCHAGEVTSYDTVFTPFGRSLRLQGMVAEDDASLIRALDALDREAIDSDHDTLTDIDELMAGGDPNTPPSTGPAPDWGYGCSASAARGHTPLTGALAAVAAVALAVRISRKRARTPRD